MILATEGYFEIPEGYVWLWITITTLDNWRSRESGGETRMESIKNTILANLKARTQGACCSEAAA